MISPEGGRMCLRAVSDGSILVGLLHLPDGFTPNEEHAYVLLMDGDRIAVDTTPVPGAIDTTRHSWGINHWLTQPIWNKTRHPDAMVVRFISAIPGQNAWTVFGPSRQKMRQDEHHRWLDVGAGGALSVIDPPFNAAGFQPAQILAHIPAWPDRAGQLHTVPSTHTKWRQAYVDLHHLLAQAGRYPERHEEIVSRIKQDPTLSEISTGRPDPLFCQFLAKMADRGLLAIEQPMDTQAYQERQRGADQAMRAALDDIEDEPGPARPRRSP